MAKRANPFVEDFVQQSKVHIGIKQFNNNEERLKKVYEKTLELLFEGAKKNIHNVSTNIEVSDSVTLKKDKMKQLCIGANGTLLRTEIVEKKQSPVQKCVCGSLPVDSQCAYCDRVLCLKCQHTCLRCLKAYCVCCSLSGSEGSDICVSCYG